mmetsp:Transcript_34218/g.59869  ORF Transcript_34218/g.59869 Transcript_34218/m.59869 type:complete len:112 (-) Transcript_34218:1916-2251(-)
MPLGALVTDHDRELQICNSGSRNFAVEAGQVAGVVQEVFVRTLHKIWSQPLPRKQLRDSLNFRLVATLSPSRFSGRLSKYFRLSKMTQGKRRLLRPSWRTSTMYRSELRWN